MALPKKLGFGGTGFHSDDAVRTRATINSLVALANALKTDHNDVLAKLDADGGVSGTDYASLRTVAAADADEVNATTGQGASFFHGDDGVKVRLVLQAIRTLANEIKTDHNALLAKLDLDGGVADTDYADATATDEEQTVTVTATGGTFTLTYDGQTTDAIAENATAATVQTELEQLSNIEVGDVVVTGSAGGPYTLTFGGNLADVNVEALTASAAGLTQAAGTGTAAVATTTAGGAAISIDHATTVAGVAPVNEVQHVTVDATSGNFTVTYAGQTTASLAFDVSAAAFTTAMDNLSNLAPGDVVVTGGPGDSGGTTPYVLTFGGTLAGTNVAEVTCASVDLAGGGASVTPSTVTPGVAAVNEQQTITLTGGPNAGNYTITWEGQTTANISATASAAAVQSALEALSNVAAGEIAVTRSGAGSLASPYVYTLTFQNGLGGANQDQATSTDVSLVVNEVQSITVTANAGTFTVTYSGQTTSAIAYNATNAAVQTALEALSNLAPADVVVTGGPGDATGSAPYVLTFGGTLADTDVAEVTTSAAALQAIGTVVIAEATAGEEPNTIVTADISAIPAELGGGAATLHTDAAVALETNVLRMIEMLNEVKRKRNVMLAKLDDDATVADTDYESLHATTEDDAA